MAAATTNLKHELPATPKPPGPCNCKADIEAKLLEDFKQREPLATAHRVALQGYGFTLAGNTMRLQPYMEIKASATYPRKGGISRPRSSTACMHFSFCPFCGQQLNAAEGS